MDQTHQPLFDSGFVAACESLALAFQRGRGGGRAEAFLRGRERGDFAGVRPYATGDDLRDLDWAAFARTDRLYMREWHHERGGDLAVLLDGSASMGAAEKWREARRAAGALAYLGLRAGLHARVSWRGCEGGDGILAAETRLERFVVWAARLESLSTAEVGTPAIELLDAEPRRAGGVGELAIVSDLLGGALSQTRLRTAAERGWRITLLQVLDHEELVPLLGPQVIRDPEGGGSLEIDVGPSELALYERELGAEVEAWRGFALAHGMRHVLCDARAGIFDALRGALRTRALGA